MRPVIVLAIYDPDGLVIPRLAAVAHQLQSIFSRAFVSVTPATQEGQPGNVQAIEGNAFFDVLHLDRSSSLREQWLGLYAHATASCQPEQVLHLCSADRVAFAFQSRYREQFVRDMHSLTAEQTPFIFHRSAAAWATHPDNYRELEHMVTRAGELLFGKTLDFGWCHMAVQAKQLQAILPHVKNHDISMVAEIVLLLRDRVQTKDVDWLAWEDPFIFDRDAQELKREREHSIAETRKRLAYVIPMLRLLDDAARREQDL